MYMANANPLRWGPKVTYIPSVRVGVHVGGDTTFRVRVGGNANFRVCVDSARLLGTNMLLLPVCPPSRTYLSLGVMLQPYVLDVV